MFFVAGVVGGDFGPESFGVVEVIEVGEFVDDDVVAERLGDIHEADVEGDGAVRRAAAPAGGSVAQAAAVIIIAIEFRVIFEAVRETFASFFHEDFFLGVAGALGFGAAEGDFFADESAVDAQKALGEKIAGVAGDGHLEAAGRRDRKPHASGERIFTHNDFAELSVVNNHQRAA